MKKKVLILYVSKYSGHYRAAEALEAGFARMPEEVEVTKINSLVYSNPILGNVIYRLYLEIIKKKPKIWENIYDNPDVVKKTKKAREALHRFNKSKIEKLVKKYSPDAVYCTQAFPCGMISDYKKASGADITLIGVLTDHAPHSYWLHEGVDYYVVPSSETALGLEKKGVPGKKIRVYGIPVDPVFGIRQDREKILLSLGLSTVKPVVLIIGGSRGLGAIEEAVTSLVVNEDRRYQLIVVTGSNKKLYKKLERISSRGIKLLAYIKNVDSLMDASDLIVTKAGGMTTSEALVKSLPMVIVKPIPGHEQMNTDYLLSRGAAVEVKDMALLHEQLNGLFDDPGKLQTMRDSATALARPESALDSALLLFEDSK
jgi:processive 1,2-diacylglycerol beta-glucosyltransferase